MPYLNPLKSNKIFEVVPPKLPSAPVKSFITSSILVRISTVPFIAAELAIPVVNSVQALDKLFNLLCKLSNVLLNYSCDAPALSIA
uniref:Uncharacterized protein n=1 Tax=Siphoviridae sp. cteoh1 TaxID=2826407 RepID=A0A8S5QL07_9CAUD|nr:MAG TPA: hypothetical protein [Siphoviridae sp. cteoh1]